MDQVTYCIANCSHPLYPNTANVSNPIRSLEVLVCFWHSLIPCRLLPIPHEVLHKYAFRHIESIGLVSFDVRGTTGSSANKIKSPIFINRFISIIFWWFILFLFVCQQTNTPNHSNTYGRYSMILLLHPVRARLFCMLDQQFLPGIHPLYLELHLIGPTG